MGDPSFNQAVTIEATGIKNSAGLFGAFLSGFFVDIFGIASFLWVLFFLSAGAALVSRWLVLKWYRWIGYALLFTCALNASSMWGLSVHGITGGGLAGDWLSSHSLLLFRSLGSILVWTFLSSWVRNWPSVFRGSRSFPGLSGGSPPSLPAKTGLMRARKPLPQNAASLPLAKY